MPLDSRCGSRSGRAFELVGELSAVETIAVNLSIRENGDPKARYGGRRWRKLKGSALVRLANGNVRRLTRGPRKQLDIVITSPDFTRGPS